MAIFTKDKLSAIKVVAINFGFTEMDAHKGIYMNDKQIVINTLVRTGVAGYTGLPMVGKYSADEINETDESPTIEQVREAISISFKRITKKPRVELDSKTGDAPKSSPNDITQTVPEDIKDIPTLETKKADPILKTSEIKEMGFDELKDTKPHPAQLEQMEEYRKKEEDAKNWMKPESKEASENRLSKDEKGFGVSQRLGSKWITGPEQKKHDEFRASGKQEVKEGNVLSTDQMEKDNGPEPSEEKHDESETKKAQDISTTYPKPPEPEVKKAIVKNCKVCGFALEPKRAAECFGRDPQDPLFICVECEENKPEPREAEVMPPRDPGDSGKTIPVKVVTQRGLVIKNFTPRCAEIGGIRIGRKSSTKTTTGGHRLPEKLDHFIVTTPEKDKDGNFLLDDVMSLLPEKPTKLNIMLLYDDETKNFSTQYREIRNGRITCSGDGEKAFDKELGREIVCNTDTCPKYLAKKCKLNGTLSVVLLDKPTIGGVYKFRTTGWNSVQSIMTSMLMIKTMTGGMLAMIPLTLTLTPKLVTPKGADKAHTIYFVNIEYHGTNLLEKVLEVSRHRIAMQSEIKRLENQSLLSAPESDEDIRDIQEEFYPK